MPLTQYRIAKDTGLPHSRIIAIIKHRHGMTATTAMRFGKYFGTAPNHWLDLQYTHDLAAAREDQADALYHLA